MNRQLWVLIVSSLTLIPPQGMRRSRHRKVRPKRNPIRFTSRSSCPATRRIATGIKPLVESWIAEELEERGQAEVTAVTGWVPLDLSPLGATGVWDGKLARGHHCPVGADIPERAEGRISVHLSGWSPGGAFVTVSLKDEPGTRVIAAVEEFETEQGMPYVAVIIGPPAD